MEFSRGEDREGREDLVSIRTSLNESSSLCAEVQVIYHLANDLTHVATCFLQDQKIAYEMCVCVHVRN